MKVTFLIFIFFAQLKDTRQQLVSLQHDTGRLTLGNFRHLHRHRLNVLPQETLVHDSEIECVLSCLEKQDCFSLNLNKTTDETFFCEFLNTTKYRDHDNLTQDDNYVHWYFQQPCLVNPCNAGRCTESDYDPAQYICDCPRWVSGQQCEHYDPTYNFALGKPTAHSSTHSNHMGSYSSSYAVDGDMINLQSYGGTPRCSITPNSGGNSWWRVDLDQEIPVARVVITSTADVCCPYELIDFEIKIGNSEVSDGSENPKCGDRHAIAIALTGTIRCSPPLYGRYLSIHTLITNDYFTICELQVYAADL